MFTELSTNNGELASKIIYVVTSSTSDVLSSQVVCSPISGSKEAASGAVMVPSSCINQLNFSGGEARVSSAILDDCNLVAPTSLHSVLSDDSLPVSDSKLFNEASAVQTSAFKLQGENSMIADFEASSGKEHSHPAIILENIDHSAPEIFAIDDCGSELYLPEQQSEEVELTYVKEQSSGDYEKHESAWSPAVELSVLPGNCLLTCLYCGLATEWSQNQMQSHMNLCCNVKRRPRNSKVYRETPRTVSPGADAKTTVDTFQLSAMSLVSKCGSYDGKIDTEAGSITRTNKPRNNSGTTWKCPVCREEVPDLREHLLEHEKEELISVILRMVIPYYLGSPPEDDDDIRIIKDSRQRNIKSTLSTSFDVEILESVDQPRYASPVNHNNAPTLSSLSIMKPQCHAQPAITSKPLIKKSPLQSNNIIALNGSAQRGVSSSRAQGTKKSLRPRLSRAPHPCPVCGKVLSSRGNVSKHLLQHSSAKPWNCSTCDVGFNSHRDWHYHQLQYHSIDRPHICPVCSKSFAILANLKEHVLFHGEKTKSCDICGKMFWTAKCVTRHKKRHYSDKKYSCSLCPKEFAIKCDYSLHCKKVHGKK